MVSVDKRDRDKVMDALTTKVTKIENRWHCRLMKGDVVFDEMACYKQTDIGYCFKEMLRWYDKMGWTDSPMASASRDRQKLNSPEGKILHSSHFQNRSKVNA